MGVHSSWIHGNAVLLERNFSPDAKSDRTIRRSFAPTTDGWFEGDVIDLGEYGGVACLRMGWTARFVVFDHGDKDYPKSGWFWCHYAIPTPALVDGREVRARELSVNCATSDFQKIAMTEIHVWDGNRRIFVESMGEASVTNRGNDGGIEDNTTDRGRTPNTDRLLKRPLGNERVFFGVLVSILVKANQAKNERLEIRGVGIDFEV